jgi:hypothetical protein
MLHLMCGCLTRYVRTYGVHALLDGVATESKEFRASIASQVATSFAEGIVKLATVIRDVCTTLSYK